MSAPRVAVATSHDGAVVTLTFGGERGNILDIATCDALTAAIVEHARAARARLLVIRGAGADFSYGASVAEHLPDQAPAMLAALGGTVRALASLEIASLAVITGRCLGGGLEVALACRLAVASVEARLGSPEIRLGVFAPAATAILGGRLPRALAADLLLAARELSGLEAERFGLVARAVPAAELEATVQALADRFASLSPAALRIALAALVAAENDARADLGARLAAQEERYRRHIIPLADAREGLEAFLAKRPPVWETPR